MSNLFENIKIREAGPNAPKGILANGSVLVAGVVEVHFTIREGKSGPFVALPARQGKDGEGNVKWYQQVRFPDEETYGKFQKEIVAAMKDKSPKKTTRTAKPADDDDSLPF